VAQAPTPELNLPPDQLPGLFAALDIAVLAERGDGRFHPLGVRPAWFRDFCPSGGAEEPIHLEECFLFLEHFLVDARAFWSKRTPGRERSGPWSESDPRGVERHLEAAALFHAEQNILLIELLGGEYEQKHGIYQKARERAIEFQKLERVHGALQASQAETADLLHSSPDTTFRLNREGRYWDFSDIASNTDAEGGQGQPRLVTDVFSPGIAATLMDSLKRALALDAGGPQVTEYEAPGAGPAKTWKPGLCPAAPARCWWQCAMSPSVSSKKNSFVRCWPKCAAAATTCWSF